MFQVEAKGKSGFAVECDGRAAALMVVEMALGNPGIALVRVVAGSRVTTYAHDGDGWVVSGNALVAQ